MLPQIKNKRRSTNDAMKQAEVNRNKLYSGKISPADEGYSDLVDQVLLLEEIYRLQRKLLSAIIDPH